MYFPMFVDISEKKIVVVGGGQIASRRIRTLGSFAKNIWVVSPEVSEEIHILADEKKIHWIGETYHQKYIADADMVLAATDDILCNEQVAGDCQRLRIPVNVSHKKELCDFYFPAVVLTEDVVIGISSDGNRHKKVREIREKIEKINEADN